MASAFIFPGNPESAEDYARRFVTSMQAWSEVVFAAGLDESRTPVQNSEILATFWQKCVARVANSPEGYAADYVQAYMRIAKN